MSVGKHGRMGLVRFLHFRGFVPVGMGLVRRESEGRMNGISAFRYDRISQKR